MTGGSTRRTRVLHVDSDAEFASTLSALVEREAERAVVFVEASAATAFDRLATEDIDCLVCGTAVAGADRLAFLREFRRRYPDVPAVALVDAATASVDSVVEAGATDAVRVTGDRDQYAVLAHRIERAVEAAAAERRVADTEAALTLLDGDAPLFVYEAAPEPATPLTGVTGACEAVTAHAASDLTGGTVSWAEDVVHEDDRRARHSAVARALERGESFDVSYRVTADDGDEHWVAEYGRPLPTEDPDAVVGFVTDVAGPDEWEDRFERERNMLESLLTDLPESIYFKDTEGRHVRASRLLHETHGDLVGKTDAELYDEELAEASERDDASVIETETPIVDKIEPVPQNRESDMWTVTTKVPWYGPDGDLQGLIGHSKTLYGGTQPSLGPSASRRLEEVATTVEADVRPRLATALAALDADDPTTVTEGQRALETARDVLDGLAQRADADRVEHERRTVEARALVRDAWVATETGDTDLALDLTYGDELETDAVRCHQLFEELFRILADADRVRVGRLDDGFRVESDAPGLIAAGDVDDVDDLIARAPAERQPALRVFRGIADTLGWDVSVTVGEDGVRVDLT